MIHVVTLILSLAGFGLLLMAMARHQQEWLRRKLVPSSSRKLRLGGFAVLALAFVVSTGGLGWTYGTLAWCGWMTVSALVTVIANINCERILWLRARR